MSIINAMKRYGSMIKLSFEAKRVKMGSYSYGIVIPLAFARLLKDNKKYKFSIEEVEQ